MSALRYLKTCWDNPMGCDHDLLCLDCNEHLLNVARNERLYRSKEALDALEAFLNRHADHHLLFPADDNWVRGEMGSAQFEMSEAARAEPRSVERSESAVVWDQMELVDGQWQPKHFGEKQR